MYVGCGIFSINCQSVSLLQAYLLLEFLNSSLLGETGSKCPLVYSDKLIEYPPFYFF